MLKYAVHHNCLETLHRLQVLCLFLLQDGRTVLHNAASWGNVHAVKALLKGGASLKSLDNTGKTALHWAAGAPVLSQDEFVREQAIREGATERSFVTNEGM